MNKIYEIFQTKLTKRCDKWLPYFDVYEKYFSKFVNQQPVVVEVGVQFGGSMQLWKEYFGPDAKIYGIDHAKEILDLDINGVTLIVGDQQNNDFWNQFLSTIPNIDCFIDDGGHKMQQQIVTLIQVWPKISQGGVYICEDTHTSYWDHYDGGFQRPNTMIEFSKHLIDLINREHFIKTIPPEQMVKIFGDVASVHFYNSMIVLEKGNKPFSRVIVNDH